ncbi:MAG: hypothetical protein QGG40_16755, partial [Myxococcota bacterium]|nr:hypothetical protein [Myxococcota bacterium]
MAPRHLLLTVLLVGCSEYDLTPEGKAEQGYEEDTASYPTDDTSYPTDDTSYPTDDTACSVDLESWDLDPRWERSAMEDRVQTDTIGTCPSETAALPTFPGSVWDDGMYTPSDYSDEAVADG